MEELSSMGETSQENVTRLCQQFVDNIKVQHVLVAAPYRLLVSWICPGCGSC